MANTFSNQITSDELFKDLTEDLALSATLEITHHCNFRCVHCYGGYERAIQDLKFEEITGIIDQLHDHGTLDLSLTGGEPLSRQDFCEIYKYARCKGMFVSVLTNASLLTKEHIEVLIEYPVSHLSITVYGSSQEVYERMTGVPGSHSMVMAAIRQLKEHNIPFELKSVATKINQHEIFAIRDFAEKLDVPFRYSTKLVPENNGCLETLDYALAPEEALWFEMNDDKKRQAWEHAAANLGSYHEHRNCRKSQGLRYLCHAGDKDVTISASGMLHLCLNERHSGYDLLSGSLEEGYERFIKVARDERAPESYGCLACSDIDFCDHCAAEIGLIKNFDFGNESNCALAHMRRNWLEDR